jgi:O-antigen ligase
VNYLTRLLLLLLGLALAATGYFAWRLQRYAPTLPANFLAAEKDYGVTIDLTQYENPDDALAAMRASGLVWLRQPVSWAEIEAAQGLVHWQAMDQVMAAVAATNETASQPFKLIAVLHTSPAWARPEDSPLTTPPTELRDIGNFARAFAARYGHQIDYYQIWHEPNLSANWGDAYVDPAAYADMLREAALNIRAVDPEATILTAALAATLEDGPLNLNELSYLDQLYQAQGNRWFDVVAVQPYGLWTKPLDAPALDQPNFRRAELIRQVLLRHGAAQTPVWATAFGWVALPADWAGRPSPWSNDLPEVQTPRTATAIQYARQNWPWLGPILAARWDTTGLAAYDPAQGFALVETPALLEVIEAAAKRTVTATVGAYPASHLSGRYSSGWRFALDRADIPRQEPRTLTISFEGTRLDLNLERGLFRGYLWVTVDGQPANALPQNGQGQSYVVLYDPLRETSQVTLAQNLSPGDHEVVIEAEGGWGQWAIQGWTVRNEADPSPLKRGLILGSFLAALSGIGLAASWFRSLPRLLKLSWAWGEILVSLFAILGERGQVGLVFILAFSLYLASGWVALALLPPLALAIILRPDLGLALTTFALFFYQTPVRLPLGNFSPVELGLALTVGGVIFRLLLDYLRGKYAEAEPPSQSNLVWPGIHAMDLAALALVLLAFLATLAAEQFALSLREWRVVVFESIIFYFLVRLGLDFSREQAAPRRWLWRLIDALVAGATLQAVLALYLYFFTDRSIDAEGVHRALGLGYGSPNNLALVLDRAWPILLAIFIFGGRSTPVRLGYGIGWLIVSLALYLTFSKGALLLGLPVGLVVMALLYDLHPTHRQHRRQIDVTLAIGLLILVLGLVPFSRTDRFRTTFETSQGSTAFFRLKLWQASWTMLREHWPLGVGLDNFLYQYRTRYILPEAWQEPNLNHPHNLILDFGTRLGVGGIALLICMQVLFWRKVWQVYKGAFDPLLLGLMGNMAIVLSHGLVDNSYFLVDLAFAFFLVLGIVQWLSESQEQG